MSAVSAGRRGLERLERNLVLELGKYHPGTPQSWGGLADVW